MEGGEGGAAERVTIYVHVCVHTYIYIYICTYIYANVVTYIHTKRCIDTQMRLYPFLRPRFVADTLWLSLGMPRPVRHFR